MLQVHPITREQLPQLKLLYDDLMGEETDWERMCGTFPVIDGDPNYYLLGAVREGELVGSVMGIVCYDLVNASRPFMVVENVIVSSAHRGLGIGRRLFQELEAIAKSRGCAYIMFVSSMHRKEAHRFYESIGYKLDSVQGFRKRLI